MADIDLELIDVTISYRIADETTGEFNNVAYEVALNRPCIGKLIAQADELVIESEEGGSPETASDADEWAYQ